MKVAIIALELLVIGLGLVYVVGVYCVEWLRWRRERLARQPTRRAPEEVQVKTWRINEAPVSHNGEQPRRPTWRRAGRTAAAQ